MKKIEKPKTIINKAREAIKYGHYDYAIVLAKYLLEKYPDIPDGKILFFKAIQSKPKKISPIQKIKSFLLRTKANIHINKGEVQEAINLLELAAETNPADTQTLLEIIKYVSHKDTSLAIPLIETINIETVHNTNLLKQIAQIMLNAKNLKEAKKILKKILIQNPNDLEVQKMLKNIEALGVLEKDFSVKTPN